MLGCVFVCVCGCVCVCGGGGGGDGERRGMPTSSAKYIVSFRSFVCSFFQRQFFLFEVTSAGVKCHVIVENDSPYFTIVP